ncbi:LGFP repeat-containing protein [Microbacterium aurantiacum]|uniref:LGFP repeat-containing protein n=1 Tax=Microbacterium aurantiacum TaxID=162393 RepID=UPI003F495FDB
MLVAVTFAVGSLVAAPANAALLEASPATRATVESNIAKGADLSQFRPGNIISDAQFFDAASMTESQIDAFLRQRVPTCQSGYTCLKDFRETTTTRAADRYCAEYRGGSSESAARIIQKVAQACGINPQVLIVTLEKEQGLVTHTWPSEWRYTIAMGQGCPDTAACDTRYYGFFNQLYGAARQFQIYTEGRYFTYYAPGKTWNIRYHPNASCGSSAVYIENQATANLYYYTPYQPNAAALRAGYGQGDGCSAYGNRNFYQRFVDWFGAPSIQVTGALNTYWQSQGGATGWIGAPTAPMRSWNGQGWSQRFSKADLYLAAGDSSVRATIGGTQVEYRVVGEVQSGLGWPRGPVLAAAGGWYQDFANGRIYVRPGDGAGFAVASPINEVYEAAGNINGVLGWPSSRAYRFDSGSRQDFAKGSVFQGPSTVAPLDTAWTTAYLSAGGPSAVGWPIETGTTSTGTHAQFTAGLIHRPTSGTAITVRGEIHRGYVAAGGITGTLGAPLESERRETDGFSQRFQGGTIYATSMGTYSVTGLTAALSQFGGVAKVGYPTGPQLGSGTSLSQDFGTTTLSTSTAGVFTVAGVIGRAYRGLGGAGGTLGAATSAERGLLTGFVQSFENGRILCSPVATTAISSAVSRILDAAGGVPGRLGWPTGPAVSDGQSFRQPFQGGEIWTSKDGAIGAPVVGAVLQTARRAGGIGVLGAPTAPEQESAAGWSQTFERGVVFVPRNGVASAATGDVFNHFAAGGGLATYGFATAPATGVGGATMQPFQNATVFTTSTGTVETRGYIRTFHMQWGGAGGVLGVPKQNEFATAGGHRQDFTGGTVLVSTTGAFLTRGALGAEYLRRNGPTGALGWPLGNETSGDGRWQQSFQGGTLVLLANGTYLVE